MSNEPQNPKTAQPVQQKNEYSNQGKTAQGGNNAKKDETAVKKNADGSTMKDGSCSSSDNKSKTSNAA